MGDVIAVVGLKREAAVLRGLDVVTIAGGGAPALLAAELTELARNADGIISFGMAGALASELRIGDWVIGTGVGEHQCDSRWVAALAQRLPAACIGPVHADGALFSDPAEKLKLNHDSGALAADMESHIAAQVAAQVGAPFAVLRCISDEADASLPPAVAVAMKPGGGLALSAVVASIVGQPAQLPNLLRTIAGFNRAYRALKAGAQAAGPRLACL